MSSEGAEPATFSRDRRDTSALRWWATIAGIVLIVLIIAADSYEAWQDYRRVMLDTLHLQVALSRALSEQTARTIQEIDLVLADYASWTLSAEGIAADARGLTEHLNAQIVSLPFVSSAALTNADAQLRASTLQETGEQRNYGNLDAFSAPEHARDRRLYIDRPMPGLGGSSPTFALSRRIDGPDGKFNGVVIARVPFDYLASFYASVDVTPDTSIRMSRDDGVTLVEYPKSDEDESGFRARQARSRESQAAPRISYPVVGGRERIEVSQRVGAYPIVIDVSRARSSVLAPWVQEERSSAARTLTLAALASLLLIRLRSALRRQEHMNQERHRLEQELAAIQRIEALGFLAASVAHDFNNVLTAIIGYAELTRESVEAEPTSLANVDRLLAATERARLLVRRVLTFDPRRSLVYRPTRVAPILIEVVQQVQASLPSSVSLSLGTLDDSAAILGDATEIHQVVMNLCSNAVHAMPAGGVVQLGMQTMDIAVGRVAALGELTPGRWIRVSINDSGVGLAEEQVASIFEPFYTTRPPTLGTGIGLTVVRNIILRTKGALDVDSRLGLGTQMAVYWPSIAPSLAPPSQARLGGAAGGVGQTIMVVDDERELVVLTEELLASLSYEPVGFSDARVALEAFRHDPRRFDAVLTDDRMQPLRGLDFARSIRELHPRVPILLMTGHRDAEVDGLSHDAAITEILEKPLRVQTLREALARHLRGTDLP